jgi:hypothetical protein
MTDLKQILSIDAWHVRTAWRRIDVVLEPTRLRRIAFAWLLAATIAACFHIWKETRVGLTDGIAHPLGEDFINFWAGAFLAAMGRADEVYDFAAFHSFQLAVAGGPIQVYHYSYPPVLLMICRPFALFSYVPAWILWSLSGWTAFAFAIHSHWRSPWAFLYALAVPATFINVLDGQNGLWTAAALGVGLALRQRRPVISGALFGLVLACKPQMGMLIPIALTAESNWRALSAALGSALLLVVATLPLYGWPLWSAYGERVAILRQVILENGETWPYMPSAFIMARHLQLSIEVSYAVQTAVALIAVIIVVVVWRRQTPEPLKKAVFVLCLLQTSPYLQNYDLAVCALVPCWLLEESQSPTSQRSFVCMASALLLLAPELVPQLAWLTGVGLGCLLSLPALWITLQRIRTTWSKSRCTT